MKIAIHHRKDGFSSHWIEYCEKNSIPYKIVDCYSTSIIDDVRDCDIVMWHFHQTNCKDILFAKQLVYSLQTAGKKVFPDFHTGWHFDDKVGQTYLLEAMGAPIVPSYLFYEKDKALNWADSTEFPKVFKLRRGAGSSQVRLIRDRRTARKMIKKAFGKGFSQYEPGSNLKERWRLYRIGKNSLWNVFKGVVRLGYTTEFDRIAGNERGYVYFQDFIPENDSDTRIIVIDEKAFAIKRLVRKNDFRASGSGEVEYRKELFDEETIRLSFQLAEKLNSQSLALDYVYSNGKPMIVEISFGFTTQVYESCEGYWDEMMNWHPGPFNPQHWMVESCLKSLVKSNV
ncbi:ATP-grasp domain-containing protein [Rhodohalobacter barkolensis]|uniref:ATP-grasp fold RimK-type domain-containing protein n=1 Tax=Rhodohalobacter barkolensis TaxID=2053187 RepID=A0A2N0VGE0_9BACT|nr:hypothetical protein [Rhodohalobacter barkolensis]PKD43262.1 hypothetical protein CWD77_11650 [Rhodohalobacter barkolensis]